MSATLQTFASSFYANEARARVIDVGVENTHGIGAAAHARNDRIGLLAVQACLREQLRQVEAQA